MAPSGLYARLCHAFLVKNMIKKRNHTMKTVCKYQSQMSRPSWFDFTPAILGLI